MLFARTNQIDKVWNNICKHEGEVFYTIRNYQFSYIVDNNCISINRDGKIVRRISRDEIEKATQIQSPNTSNIGGFSASYIYALITDNRIN